MSRSYQQWLLEFITWVGNVSPNFGELRIDYERYTVRRFVNKLDLETKILDFVKLMLNYPLKELKDLVSIVLGISEKHNKMGTLRNIGKGVVYVLGKIAKKASTRQACESYAQRFSREVVSDRDNSGFFEKIMAYKYGEWLYDDKARNRGFQDITRF